VKVKNISGQDLRCEWVPGGYVDADAVVDVPDRQPDTQQTVIDDNGNQVTVTTPGDPLIWHPDFWEPVKTARSNPDDPAPAEKQE